LIKSIILIAITLTIVTSLTVTSSYGAEIILNTNKGSYGPGDIVELSGTVRGGVEGDLTAIEVKSPSGETILIRSVQLGPGGSYFLKFKLPESGQVGNYNIAVNAQVSGETISETKTILQTSQSSTTSSDDGGCLIATATYGSELAPQVQQLRELRDNTLLQTNSGTVFMTGFNQLYYSFSPTVADWERQSPLFKEAVKLTIIPLLSSLSILNYVDLNSESEILGYGIGVILLNVGMYFVAPAMIIIKIRSKFS